MKRLLLVLAVLLGTTSIYAQNSKIPTILDVVSIESEDNEISETVLEIFNMPKDGENHYYLNVGTLAFGDEIIQVQIDPASMLFIPLGNTLDESMEMLLRMKDLFKEPKGSSIEVQGCLTIGFPNDKKLEPVKLTYRKAIVSSQIEFSVKRDGYIRATYFTKGNISSLITSLKLYRKFHKKEK